MLVLQGIDQFFVLSMILKRKWKTHTQIVYKKKNNFRLIISIFCQSPVFCRRFVCIVHFCRCALLIVKFVSWVMSIGLHLSSLFTVLVCRFLFNVHKISLVIELSFLHCLCPKCPEWNVSKVSCLLYSVSIMVSCTLSNIHVLCPLLLSYVHCFCLVSIVLYLLSCVLCLLSYICCLVSICLLSCINCLLSIILCLFVFCHASFVSCLSSCVYMSFVMHQLSPVSCLVYIVPTLLSIVSFVHFLVSTVMCSSSFVNCLVHCFIVLCLLCVVYVLCPHFWFLNLCIFN